MECRGHPQSLPVRGHGLPVRHHGGGGTGGRIRTGGRVIHTGKPLSFVYDIADLFKFDTVVPIAFRIAARSPREPEREVRLACRDLFRSEKLLGRIIPTIEEVLAAGGIQPPEAPVESVPPAIPNPEGIGEIGHRVQG